MSNSLEAGKNTFYRFKNDSGINWRSIVKSCNRAIFKQIEKTEKGSCGYRREEELVKDKISTAISFAKKAVGKGIQVDYLLVSVGNSTAARCCNTANSSLTIDGKFEILNKRIGSVQN